MYRNIALCFLFLCLFSYKISAQARWIANVRFINTTGLTLYDLNKENKPLVLAVGNIHTQASERLFETHLLQKLVRDHSAITAYSTRDIQVAFLNVRVFPDEPVMQVYNEVPVFNIDESDSVLSLPGWNEIYSITATGLYLITPDHLVYTLDAATADDVYSAVKAKSNKLRPIESPDVRLLDVHVDEQSGMVHADVQNFSKNPLHNVQISISIAGTVFASAVFTGTIASLDAVTIQVPMHGATPAGSVEVTAIVKGDTNPLNNVWTGRLLPAGSQPVVVGKAAK